LPLLPAFGVFAVLSGRQPEGNATILFWMFVLGLFAFGVFWLLSLRVSFHPDGISKETCLGRKEMRWDDVDRFYYAATRRRVNFIPVGTYYSFRLIDRERNNISLSNSVERPFEIGTKLAQQTHAPLFKKVAKQFNSGAALDFGPVRLSRADGIKIKKFFGRKRIALNQVASYRIEKGRLYVFKVGEKRTTGPSISRIPNVFVLVALLDAIRKPASQ